MRQMHDLAFGAFEAIGDCIMDNNFEGFVDEFIDWEEF
jgi:hypothetical protein